MEILSKNQKELLARERDLLSQLSLSLAEFGVEDKDQSALVESIRQLDDFFL